MDGDEHGATRLDHYFTFWYTFFKKGKEKQLQMFEDNLKQIGSFSSAEEFWGIYQHMRRPDSLPRGSEFFLFKKGIKPMWEDPANADGGRLYISVKKTPAANKIWEDLQIAMLIVTNDDFEVNGVVLNVRVSEVVFSIWTKALSEYQVEMAKAWLLSSLELPKNQVIEYKKHPKSDELSKKIEQPSRENDGRYKKNQSHDARAGKKGKEEKLVVQKADSELGSDYISQDEEDDKDKKRAKKDQDEEDDDEDDEEERNRSSDKQSGDDKSD